MVRMAEELCREMNLNSMFSTLFLLVLWAAMAFFCGVVAGDKGHEGMNWFMAGVVLGPFALLAVTGLSDRKQRRLLNLLVEERGIDTSKPVEAASTQARDLIQKSRGW